MKLHLVALPHTQTTAAFSSCAYTQKVIKFCKMMRAQGYQVALYGSEINEAECDEHVVLITEDERAGWFGPGFDTVLTPLEWNPAEPYWMKSNLRAAAAIADRIENEHDLLCLIGGDCQQPVATALPAMQAVEWGVGYKGVFARFRAFESHAWRHWVYGARGIEQGIFYDAVIPNFFDPADFPRLGEGGDNLLFIGRLIQNKGVGVALDIAERVGRKLIIAGPGATSGGRHPDGRSFLEAPGLRLDGNFEYVGTVTPDARARLIEGVAAVVCPTLYVEPFGGVAVEAMMSGTPAISTDFGAFTETVINGVTGQRFCTLAEGAAAVDQVAVIDRAALRERTLATYSLDAIGPQFTRWFEQIDGLWGDGWTG